MEPTQSPNGRQGTLPRPYPRLARFERLSGRRSNIDGLFAFLADVAHLATQITAADSCCEIRLTTTEPWHPIPELVRASSDEFAAMLGTIQDNLGQGPCLEALSAAQVRYVPDTRTEQRWPVFTLAARLHGFRSLIVQPLTDRSGTAVGTLTLYSRRASAYTLADRRQLAELATVVADITCRTVQSARSMTSTEPATEFEITNSEHAGVAVVAVTGDVDLATSTRLRHELLQLLWNRPGQLIVALEQVSFIDAAGIRTIAIVNWYAHLTGTEFRIAGPSRLVRKMFGLTGMDKALAVFPSFADALADALIDRPHNQPAS